MNAATPILAAVAALTAALATAALLHWRAHLPLAAMNARTLHETPIPRVGGLAIWAGWIPVTLASPALPSMTVMAWGIPLLALGVVSLADDMREVAIVPRLTVHAAAAVWFACVALGLEATLESAALVLLVALVAAWAANLYNFMDGSDGLATSMTVAGFAAYGAVLIYKGFPAALPTALAAATLPVLVANWPRARIFLGDVGAVPVGFLAAAIGVGGVVDGAWPAWFPVLVFLPFIADATLTLVRRALTGERFWEGHKAHYYQRLHQLGAGHAGTLAVFGSLLLGTAGTAVACACLRPEWGPAALVAWCTVCALLFATIDYHWRKFTRRN